MKVTTQQICDDLSQMLDHIKVGQMAMADELGLTKVQLFAIYALETRGELPMGQVASVLHCDASNVTGIVDRLVAQGLVVRRECLNDRRAKQLALTDKGMAIGRRMKAALPKWVGCDKLAMDDRCALHDLIQKMLA